jgi:hypothetical protein
VHPLRHPSAPAGAAIDSIPSDVAFGTIKPVIRALLEQMAARLEDKDALLKKSEELANAREIELIRAVVEVHAIYSPRPIISSIIEAVLSGACGIAIGEKHIHSFIIMIGGMSSTESQRTALALIIALGQQQLLKLMGTCTDPMIDPVGLNEPLSATELKENAGMVFMARQITRGHVQGIP